MQTYFLIKTTEQENKQLGSDQFSPSAVPCDMQTFFYEITSPTRTFVFGRLANCMLVQLSVQCQRVKLCCRFRSFTATCSQL